MKKKIAILLILLGVIFFSLPKLSEIFLMSNSTTSELENISGKQLEKNAASEDKNFDASKIDPIDMNGVILKRDKADLSKVIGQLVIPSINKNIAVFDGLENNNLLYGAATMKPNQKMGHGNYAIAGHFMKNEKLLFGGLMKVKNGDKIRLTNKKNIYEYEVYKTEKVNDDRIDLISDDLVDQKDGRGIISLMTCYYDENGYRYFVFGKFKRLYPYSEAKMLEGISK